MTNVIEQTRSLAEAILESQEYRSLQIAESAAEEDPAAAALNAQLGQRQQALTEMLQSDPESLQVSGIRQEIDALRQSLSQLPSIEARDNARMAFSQLMAQVNNVLQFILMGEISEGSCSGNCGSCGGCR